MGDGQVELGAGDVFVFTRSATAHSYLVMAEYVMDFLHPQIISRINLVPIARAQWQYFCCNNGSYNWTKDSTNVQLFSGGSGADGTANNTIANVAVGDIYRFVVDVDNSQFTTATGTTITPSNVFDYVVPDTTNIVLKDGFTLYMGVDATNGVYRFFPTLATARQYTTPLRAGLTGTGSIVLCGWVCLVDSIEGVLTQSSV